MPGPRNASAFAMSAWTSAFVLAHRVSEKSDQSGIRYDSAGSLGDNRGSLFNRVAKIAATVVTMHALAKPIALLEI